MNWFTEIFSSTSDQARLATTMIAAAIAIFVVFINQAFNSRRSRNSIIIEKIEEMYVAIIKLDELSSTIHHEIITNYQKYDKQKSKKPYSMFSPEIENVEEDNLQQLNEEFNRTGATAYMLSGLYFPHLKKDIKTLKETYLSLYLAFVTSESLSEYIDFSEEHRPSLKLTLSSIYKSLSITMNKQMYNKAVKWD